MIIMHEAFINLIYCAVFLLSPGSLKDRHIKNNDILYAIFTPKQNLKSNIVMRNTGVDDTPGEHTVRCHIMLKVRVEYLPQ